MTKLEERLLWIALVAALVIGFGWYEQERRESKCELSDALSLQSFPNLNPLQR